MSVTGWAVVLAGVVFVVAGLFAAVAAEPSGRHAYAAPRFTRVTAWILVLGGSVVAVFGLAWDFAPFEAWMSEQLGQAADSAPVAGVD